VSKTQYLQEAKFDATYPSEIHRPPFLEYIAEISLSSSRMFGRIVSFLTLLWGALSVNTVKDCSSGTSLFKFISGSLTPDPVIPGQDSSITINAQIPDGVNITDGTAKYTFTLNGIPFAPETDPLCGQVACPLLPGPYTNTTTSVFPTGVSGKISTVIQWYDTSNTLLLCTDVTTRV